MDITPHVQDLIKAALSDGVSFTELIDEHTDKSIDGDRESRIVNLDIADELIKVESAFRKANLI